MLSTMAAPICKLTNSAQDIPLLHTKEIQMVVRKQYKQLYVNKLDNQDKIDKFLETYNLATLNQEESENLNRQVTTREIEAVTKKLPTNKSPGPDGFTGEFYQTFKRHLF